MIAAVTLTIIDLRAEGHRRLMEIEDKRDEVLAAHAAAEAALEAERAADRSVMLAERDLEAWHAEHCGAMHGLCPVCAAGED